MIVKCKRVRIEEEFRAPFRWAPGDAGFDLTISRYLEVFPGANAHLSTNVAVQIPVRFFGMIVPRSSTLAHKGLHVSTGIVDSGYRGEVMILVRNLTDRAVHVQVGDRVAQLLILPLVPGEFKEGDLNEGSRGDAGFGSTGR